MKIGIVGAGKVGTTLGKYLMESRKTDIIVTGYYSKSYESAEESAKFTGTKSFKDEAELIRSSDTLFIATPDGELKSAWDCIAEKNDINDKIICHFSGSLSSDIFSDIESKGAVGCSFHPVYAFSDKFSSYINFNTAAFVAEGDEQAVSRISGMFEGLGHKVIHMNGMNKGLYHTSMVCASNLMISLLNMSVNMLEICDINESDAYSILKSLTLGNVSNAFEKGCAQALSGPVERADIDTIRKHIEVLEHFKNQENHQNTSDGNGSVVIKCEPGEEKQQDIKDMDMVYRILSQKLIAVASKKNPDRDYSKLKDYLSSL